MDFIDYKSLSMQKQTRIVQRQNQSYITAVTNGTRLGYKYFDGAGIKGILLETKGVIKGNIVVSKDEEGKDVIGKKTVEIDSKSWKIVQISNE